MKRFDINAVRREVLSDTGIARSKKADFEKMRVGGGLWGSAREFMGTAIKSILVGIDNEAPALFDKAKQWLQAAISTHEATWSFPPHYREAAQHEVLALCSWLKSGNHDSVNLGICIDFLNKYLSGNPPELRDPHLLGQTLLNHLDGAAYTDVLQWIAQGGKTRIPDAPSRARGEAVVLGILACQRLDPKHSQEAVEKMVSSLLGRHMNEWLTTGRELHAAHWLKVAFAGASLQPRDVILKAFDYLPAEAIA